MNDTIGQVAVARHREMVDIGLHHQFIASALEAAQAPRGDHDRGSAALRPQLGAAMRRAGILLRGGHVATGERIGAIAHAGQS